MSNDDLDSGVPAHGKQEATPAGSPDRKPLPHLSLDEPEEETFVRRNHRPALRLAAWLLAFVLLLVVLGWAIGEIL